jgi:hypothetical protein
MQETKTKTSKSSEKVLDHVQILLNKVSNSTELSSSEKFEFETSLRIIRSLIWETEFVGNEMPESTIKNLIEAIKENVNSKYSS